VYDIFPTADGDRLFVGVVTDTQWEVFCREFGEPGLAADPRLATNGARVKERDWLVPRLAETFKRFRKAELAAKLEAIGLPFAPIATPAELFDDPHLRASGGLLPTSVKPDFTVPLPALPLEMGAGRLPKRSDPPAIGEHTRALLSGLGYAGGEIEKLIAARVVAGA
jgi:crotonobetainyl-CoA:carnitine CoA-transferase CaiB-like acyl-CoA transferase